MKFSQTIPKSQSRFFHCKHIPILKCNQNPFYEMKNLNWFYYAKLVVAFINWSIYIQFLDKNIEYEI